MTTKIFLLIWLVIIAICILEVYFSVPYDKDFNEYKLKKEKRHGNKRNS